MHVMDRTEPRSHHHCIDSQIQPGALGIAGQELLLRIPQNYKTVAATCFMTPDRDKHILSKHPGGGCASIKNRILLKLQQHLVLLVEIINFGLQLFSHPGFSDYKLISKGSAIQ